ncbi:S26 family signal peptidase [Streptomyces sp. NPDC020766]|uniref:S26 family signal peptidase n=1 Tax=Streptomyces sp. NPDC020766 TaxID=3155011 RepID=UPI0033D24103
MVLILIGTGLAVALGAGAVLLGIRRHWVVVTVDGTSMLPAYAHGDRVLVRRRRLIHVRTGDVVVLEPPLNSDYRPTGPGADGRHWNIKRAAALPGDPVPPHVAGHQDTAVVPLGALVVFGDNPDSIDSRHRGFYAANQLLGVVVRLL